jgi:iron complex transport system substrate-binding protein
VLIAAAIMSADQQLRIVSLLPSITEILCELGLSEQIVGITHECDYPPSLFSRPDPPRVVTTSEINPFTMTQEEIHDAVCGSLKNGQSLYGLNGEILRQIRPNVIFTQSLCDVCAVSYPVVLDTCAKLLGGPSLSISEIGAPGTCTDGSWVYKDGNELNPLVISMEPTNLKECMRTFHVAADALGRPDIQTRAEEVTSRISEGLETIRRVVKEKSNKRKPKVAFLEWHNPIFCGGHWIADMLEIAGAEYVMPCQSGDRSIAMTDEDFQALDVDYILIGPCGFSLSRSVKDTLSLWNEKPWWKEMTAVKEGRVFALDGNSYYARPGPRLMQGAAIMAACIHGEEVASALGVKLCPPAGYCQISMDMYDTKVFS